MATTIIHDSSAVMFLATALVFTFAVREVAPHIRSTIRRIAAVVHHHAKKVAAKAFDLHRRAKGAAAMASDWLRVVRQGLVLVVYAGPPFYYGLHLWSEVSRSFGLA